MQDNSKSSLFFYFFSLEVHMGDNGKRAKYTITIRIRIDEDTFNKLSTIAKQRNKKPSTLAREFITDTLKIISPMWKH